MNKEDLKDFNFKRILLECEIENKSFYKETFDNEKMMKLNTKTIDAFKIKVNENCNKYYSDIHFFSKYAQITEDFKIKNVAFPGKEKEVDLLKKKWYSCFQKFKDRENSKNNSIKNILYINESFLLDCFDDCRQKNTATEQKNCVRECYRFHKINSSYSAIMLRKTLMNYINDMKNELN